MAKVTKEENVEQQGLTGIKEESEKGEIFFRVVLMLMAIAFLSVVIYFIVDAIIGNKTTNEEKMYDKFNYILVSDLEKVINDENFENITSEAFKDALNNLDYVYVLFFNENNIEDHTEGTQDRQSQALNIVDLLLKNKEEVILDVELEELEEDEKYIYYRLDDNSAIFFLDVSDASNSSWASLIDTSEGQASSKNFPALFEIYIGEDINWYGPWKSAGQNVSSITKLNDILESKLNY